MMLPFAANSWPWAVVEVAADGGQLKRRVRDAYLASESGVVGLVLRGVTPEAVDRVLDEVVDARDAKLKGVLYLDDSEEALVRAASHAGVVVATTERFRALLDSRGIPFISESSSGDLLKLEVSTALRGSSAPARA